MNPSNHNQSYKSTGPFYCLVDACQGVFLRAPDGIEFEVLGRLDELAEQELDSISAHSRREQLAFMEDARGLARAAALTAATDPKRPMTTKEAAAWLRKSRSFVYRHADELGARRVGTGRGSDLLFRLGELEGWLEARRERRQ